MSEDPTRLRLLEAAGRKFAEKGFDATNVREITEAAGTSLASVNYHFRSKEDLYIEAVRHAGTMCDKLMPIRLAADDTPEERLRVFVRTFVSRMISEDAPEWCRTLIMREIGAPRPGACELFVHSFIKPSFFHLSALVREMVGDIVPQEDVHLIGSSIVAQCLHYHHARNVIPHLVGPDEWASYDVERLTDHIWRFSLAAIRGMKATHGGIS